MKTTHVSQRNLLKLGTKISMILGHKSFGTVMATLKGGQLPGQIGSIVEAINELENATKANVALKIKRIISSPVIAQLIAEVKLKVIAGVYDLDTGKVNFIS